jgi:uncharacterized protein YqeY
MSTILEQLADQIKDAMRAKDSFKLGVLRMLKSEAKNKEVEAGRTPGPLTDEEFIAVLNRMVNQRKDSVAQFTNAGRADMAQNESAEIEVLATFLPKQLTESEVQALIAEAIQKTGAQGAKGMGTVMKEIKEKTFGRFDGKQLSDMVKTALG